MSGAREKEDASFIRVAKLTNRVTGTSSHAEMKVNDRGVFNDWLGVVDRPTQLICISDIFVHIQIQGT